MKTTLKILVLLLLATGGISFGRQSPPAFPRLTGPYLGQAPPGDRAELFSPGIVSSEFFEHSSPVFTPDLKEIYWSTIIDRDGQTVSRPILFMTEVDGAWTRPEIPPFARKFACTESPFISPDGKRLYFHASGSLRPETAAIYYVERTGTGWSDPIPVGKPINDKPLVVQPSVSGDGTIYYVCSGGLYHSKPVAGRYQEPVFMDPRFNSGETDWTPYIAPDESYFIFCSFRPGGFGSGDLYISFKQADGSWGKVINMGPRINGDLNERFPNVTPDGKYLFFNSTRKIPGAGAHDPGNGQGDVYWIDARIIEELKKTDR